ncbi:MAG: acylneuraminate cytidylyltransferase family protein [Candidatus Paceibacterota bacterium]|jgi:CMP-N-acetylneuraminic acid synthetase
MNIHNKKILAIIPARGGSKRIPKKNIRLLAGKPLIYYSIASGLESEYIDRVVVSTEDDEVAAIAKKYKAEVVKRPKKLAGDKSKTIDAVFHAIQELGKKGYRPDIVVLLQPTSPLRTSVDVDQAIELFLKNKCDSVVGVRELDHPLYWTLKIDKGSLLPLFGWENVKIRSQDAPKNYVSNGAIFVITPESLEKNKGFFTKKTSAYIMPAEKSTDIDAESDFKLAELILKSYARNKNRK